jgi:hypothetical protein
MFWLAWAVARALLVGSMVLAFAVVGVVMRSRLADSYSASIARCKAHDDCSQAPASFLALDCSLKIWPGDLVTEVPGVPGIFLDAPLVASELESGSLRVAWTQSATRT